LNTALQNIRDEQSVCTSLDKSAVTRSVKGDPAFSQFLIQGILNELQHFRRVYTDRVKIAGVSTILQQQQKLQQALIFAMEF
jgi:hypothetical protein